METLLAYNSTFGKVEVLVYESDASFVLTAPANARLFGITQAGQVRVYGNVSTPTHNAFFTVEPGQTCTAHVVEAAQVVTTEVLTEGSGRVQVLDVPSVGAYVSDNPKAVMLLTASWCSPCNECLPAMEESCNAHSDMAFAMVDVGDADSEPLPVSFAIKTIPTIVVFNDGKECCRHEGTGGIREFLQTRLAGSKRVLDAGAVRD